MNLVWFLTIGAFFSIILGEFSHFPFGASGLAVSLTDIILSAALFFLLVWQVVDKKIAVPKSFKWLALFWLVAALSLIISGQLAGGLYLVRFMVYSGALWLGYHLIKSKQIKLDTLIKLIISSSLVLSILGFLQLIIYPDLTALTAFGFDPHINRLVSTFLDPNFLGAYLSIPLLLGLYQYLQEKKKVWLGLSAVILIAVILTFSRSAYLMLGVSLAIFCAVKMRKLLLGLALIGAVLYLVASPIRTRINGAFSVDASAAERFGSWQNGLYELQNHPVLGVGFDNLRSAFERDNKFKVFSENGGHSGAGVDSSLLFVGATTGILGLLSYLLFWLFYFKNNLKKRLGFVLFCLSLGFLVESQFINSLFYPPIMLSMFLLMGANNGAND